MGKGFYGIIVDKDPNFRSIAKNKLTRSLVHSFFVCKISAEFLASFTLVPKSCRHKEMNNNNNFFLIMSNYFEYILLDVLLFLRANTLFVGILFIFILILLVRECFIGLTSTFPFKVLLL